MKAVLICLALAAAVHSAGIVSVDLTERVCGQFQLIRTAAGELPFSSGAYAATESGEPSIPRYPVSIRIPFGTAAFDVSSEITWEEVSQNIYVPPLPEPRPLHLGGTAEIAQPNPMVYESSEWWPEEPVELTGTGWKRDTPAAEILVAPFRWNPSTGELQRISSIRVTVRTESSETRRLGTLDEGETCRMLIVTDQSMEAAFQELAERRYDQGILTEVVTTDQIYASASGRDNAEELRNYIKDYYTNNGLDYLLLGGDTDWVPFRKAYAMTCEAGLEPREDSLPCDLYFSDLDGDWDANGNSVFGEVEDNVDLYPDVFVGRAPVNSISEAEIFVDNIAAYEDCTHDDFYKRVLFLAEILWNNPYTNSAESKNYIDENFLPDFLEITKLYESLGNENITTVMAALNQGQNFINHDGHAWFSSIGIGDGYMGYSDVDDINSSGRFAASMYSIGCWSGAFDYDAIAEHFLVNPEGGSVGYIGNSSYGWGSPGNPCYGYSDALDHLYHDYLYSDYSLTNGELLAMTKEFFIPYSRWENVYRWHQYDVNLLGDPSLRAYRGNQVTPNIDCPSMITANASVFPVQVSGADPEGLTVCLHDENEYWEVVQLDETGYFTFSLPSAIQGELLLTVTGPNVERTQVSVPVSSGPQPVVSSINIIDTGGDGTLSPGDMAHVDLTLLNQGSEGLTNITLDATLVSGPGSLLEDSMNFPDLAPCSSSIGSEPLDLSIDQSALDGDVMNLELLVTASEGSWTFQLPLRVCAPGLYFTTYSIDDSASGNDNGIPEPGETFDLTAAVCNFGLLSADSVSAIASSSFSYLDIVADSAWTESIQKDSTADFSFTCQLDASSPSPSFPWITLDLESATAGCTFQDSLRLTVGETGISNDVESGPAGWTHSGTADMWNITSDISHSSSHSWHCGDSGGYVSNMDCGLLSPEMILAPQAQLSFWATFDVAIYGTDGMYVIVNDLDANSADTLDYIGSGGALGLEPLGTGTGWAQWSYSLDQWETGDNVQLEFRFISDDDSDTGQGFYVDDISVEGAYTGSTSLETPQVLTPAMGNPSPNPSSETFSVQLNIAETGIWEMALYDIAGRKLIHRRGEAPVAESVEMDVTGLTPGVYFLKLRGAANSSARLVVLDR